MTDSAVRGENFLAAIGLGQFRRLFAARTLRSRFFVRWDQGRIKTVAAKISREPPEIGAAEKDREAINRDEPDRERFEPGARFPFFSLNRGVDLVDVGCFSVIHSLPLL